MRLDILMEYSVRFRSGSAALRWTDPMHAGPDIQAHLVALLYGRILSVHAETRAELFLRVGELSKENVRTEGATGFEFDPWTLHVGLGGGDFTLWPWHMTSPENLSQPTTYSATLRYDQPSASAPNGRWIHLDMAFGLERIFAPSSPLIGISGFSKSCDEEARYGLALLLWQMNEYWRSPDRISVGTEARAYAAALDAIRSGQLRVP